MAKSKSRGGRDPSPPKGRSARRSSGRWIALISSMIVTLALWLAFFVLVACYLFPVFGKGWMWLVASAAFALAVPLGLAVWMVRPLSGFKRAAWFTGAFAAVPLLAVLGLSAGARSHTANVLRKHGPELFHEVFGSPTRSALSRTGETATEAWAGLLRAPPKAKKKPPARRVAPRARTRPKPRRALFYEGHRRPRARPPGSPLGRAIAVRFQQRGGAWLVRARLAGRKAAQLRLQLDTGATLTALSNEAARSIGLQVPEHPVTVELDTAGGRKSFPLAILRRLSLGGAELRNVTVALCDDCANPGLSGLLGLNFARHFQITIDQRKSRLTLRPYRGKRNRIDDVEPYLKVSDVAGELTGTQVSLTGKVRNRSPRTVRNLRLVVALLDSKEKVRKEHPTEIGRIKPNGTATFTVQTTGDAEVTRYRIELVSAHW